MARRSQHSWDSMREKVLKISPSSMAKKVSPRQTLGKNCEVLRRGSGKVNIEKIRLQRKINSLEKPLGLKPVSPSPLVALCLFVSCK